MGQPGSCPCCHLAPHPPSEALEPTCPPSLSHSPGLRHPDSGAASSSKWSHAEPGPQPLGSAGQARGTQGTWDAATRVGRGRGVGRGKSALGASCRAASPLGGSGLVQSGVVGLVTASWNGPSVTEASCVQKGVGWWFSSQKVRPDPASQARCVICGADETVLQIGDLTSETRGFREDAVQPVTCGGPDSGRWARSAHHTLLGRAGAPSPQRGRTGSERLVVTRRARPAADPGRGGGTAQLGCPEGPCAGKGGAQGTRAPLPGPAGDRRGRVPGCRCLAQGLTVGLLANCFRERPAPWHSPTGAGGVLEEQGPWPALGERGVSGGR